MDPMSREGLERLAVVLAERIGAPCESGEDAGRAEPLRRQVRHAVTGIDAYLGAVEAGSCSAVGLRERALDLWDGLERIVAALPAHDTAGTAGADVREGGNRVPVQPAPLP
ncbi:hypothetical protein BG452_02945 [Streptomyces sp. CBMA123]|nr:hypothetical protein [Streptomyces sp. CBMA123]